MSADEKRCRKCNEWKPLAEFTERRDKPGAYSPACKACDGAKKQKQAQRQKVRQRENAIKASKVMKRSPLKAVSDHRKEVNVERKKRMIERFGDPKTWECRFFEYAPPDAKLPKCFGSIHGHELLSRAKAGRTDENLLNMDGIITLCDLHNGWVEDFPLLAKQYGLKL